MKSLANKTQGQIEKHGGSKWRCNEMEHQAARARVRAERRCGELLKKMEKNKGHRFAGSTVVSEPVPTIPEMGLTHKQSSKFQQLASVPEDEFEVCSLVQLRE